MTILESIEEAFEQCGLTTQEGYDIATGRRSVGLLYKRWANRGFNGWQLKDYSLVLTAGTAEYTLPVGTYDLPLLNIRRGPTGAEISLGRPLSMTDYSNVPNKRLLGMPVNYFIQKQGTAVQFHLWPTPNSSDLHAVGFRAEVETISSANDESIQIPDRYEPAFIAGLAAAIARKKIQDLARVQEMEAYADKLWEEARRGDSGWQSLRIIPQI